MEIVLRGHGPHSGVSQSLVTTCRIGDYGCGERRLFSRVEGLGEVAYWNSGMIRGMEQEIDAEKGTMRGNIGNGVGRLI